MVRHHSRDTEPVRGGERNHAEQARVGHMHDVRPVAGQLPRDRSGVALAHPHHPDAAVRGRADARGENERPVTAPHQLVDQVRDRDGDGLLGWWEVSGHDGRSHASMLTR